MKRSLLNPFGVSPSSIPQRRGVKSQAEIWMLCGRPLRSGSERIRRRSIPQALVFLGHYYSRIANADLAEVDASSRRLDPIRIFERGDLQDLGIDGFDSDLRLCHILGFAGVVCLGLHLRSEPTTGANAIYVLCF